MFLLNWQKSKEGEGGKIFRDRVLGVVVVV